MDDERFQELLQVLVRNCAGFDDMALFTIYTHSPASLKTISERAQIMPERFEALRKCGFGVGINFLCAVGFFPENMPDIPDGIPPFLYPSGEAARGRFCHNTESYRNYFREALEILAKTGPEFIWLDDDNRGFCCCELCIADFNRYNGSSWTLEDLRNACDDPDSGKALAVRRQFLKHSSQSLARHYEFAASIVHGIDSSIVMGGMNVMRDAWDDFDYSLWQKALGAPDGTPVRWRPGGGTWTERIPDELLTYKGPFFGLNAAWMPDWLTDRRSEVENFPYQGLKKSSLATALEGCIYNACGMTGTTWNVLDDDEDISVQEPLLRTLAEVRPFLDAQVKVGGVEKPRGIWNGWIRGIGALYGFGEDDSWVKHSVMKIPNPHAGDLFSAGLPPAYCLESAEAVILLGNIVQILDDATILQILSKGLYCDVPALRLLTERGYAKYLGFMVGKQFSADMRERLLSHPLNGSAAGHCRNARQAFSWHEECWELVPSAEGAETLTELVNYQNLVCASCGMGIFCNELGGRVAVSGYFANTQLHYSYKLHQMKNLFNFLSGKTLTAWVESFHRVSLWVRQNAITLVNTSLEPAQNVILRVRGENTEAELLCMDGNCIPVSGLIQQDGTVRFILPRLESFHAYLFRHDGLSV